MSDYVRRTALGHRPHLRLTEREVEALCSLSDARGDLIRVVAAVKSIQADKRAIYFSDTRFVEQWKLPQSSSTVGIKLKPTLTNKFPHLL